jgi:hypothetical protein
MLEGTRHEKIALVITSYVIGFVTAFIGFGLNQVYLSEQLQSIPAQEISFKQTVQKQNSETIISANLATDGLSAITSERKIFLSANKNVLSGAVIGSSDVPGFHYAIVGAEVSRNGKFVYFCEQFNSDSVMCDPYVYSLSDGMLHTVKRDGAEFQPVIADHNSSWTIDNFLRIQGAQSINAESPWLLHTAERAD